MRRAIALLLLAAYGLFLLFAAVIAPKATLWPVVLATEDLLLGLEEPLAVSVRAIDARSGAPVRGVPLRFLSPGFAGSAPRELPAVTDARGAAAVVFPREPVSGHDVTGSGEQRIGVTLAATLAEPSRLVLASPWPAAEIKDRRAVIDVFAIDSALRVLLVDLDGLERGGEGHEGLFEDLQSLVPGWPSSPRQAFLDRVEEESRLRDRVLYIASLDGRFSQRAKLWLEASGLPEGLLLVSPAGESKADWLKGLARRLSSLDVKAEIAVCAGAAGGEAYPGAFEGLKVLDGAP